MSILRRRKKPRLSFVAASSLGDPSIVKDATMSF